MECIGHLYISVVEGRNLALKASARPSVVIQVGEEQAKTEALAETETKWLSDFRLNVFSEDELVGVILVDDTHEKAIGKCSIALRDLTPPGGTTAKWVTVKDKAGREVGQICLVLRFLKGALSHGMNGAVSRSFHSKHMNGSHRTSTPDIRASSEKSLRKSTSSSLREEKTEEEKPVRKSRRGKYLVAAGGALVAFVVAALAVNNHRSKRQSRYHEVKPGETLCSIADRYGLKPDDVFEANMDVTSDPDRLYPGDKVYIP